MRVFSKIVRAIKKRKIAGFDIETKGNKNNFLMGSVQSDKGKFIFWDCDELIDYIMKDLRGYWVYATNLDFDFFALFKNHLKKYPNEPIFRNKLLCVKCWTTERHKGKRQKPVYFLDTMNYVSYSVEKLGKIIGLDKLEHPEFLGKDIEYDYVMKKEMEQYNLRDTEITYQFMLWFQDVLNNIGGELQITIAKTSLNIFQREYFDDLFFQPKNYVNDFIREGYYGGRTEVFKRGEITNMNYYDINSLYPSVMINEIPNPNSYSMKKKCEYADIYKTGMIRCVVECPENISVPYLPFRLDTKLIFPTGTFEGVWTTYEIRYAEKLGYKIKELKDGVLYSETKKYFEKFVNDMYAKRMEQKKEHNSIQLVYKLLLNSLYGKFGQQETTDVWIHLSVADGIELKDIKEIVDDTYVRITRRKTSTFVHPIISATVTAYARTVLYKYLSTYDCYYCDTDSIITPNEMETSKKLGDMKLEGFISEGILVKPKFYSLVMNGKKYIKLKGAMRIKEHEFESIVKGVTKSYIYEKFLKYKESIKRKMSVNEKISVTKTFDLEDTKRHWFGKKFNPYELQPSKAILLGVPTDINTLYKC